MMHALFSTAGFRDPPEAVGGDFRGPGGLALAGALRVHLSNHGIACDPIVDGEFGWMFLARDGETGFVCACALNPAEGAGAVRDGRVTVRRDRRLVERLLGRNRDDEYDRLPELVFSFLASRAEIAGLSRE